MTINYEEIKRMAKEKRRAGEGVKVADLLALTRYNDPFYVGSASQRRDAEWFVEWFGRLGYSHPVHLRKMHYALVALTDVPLPTTIRGTNKETKKTYETALYLNEDNVWSFLCDSSKFARYLGLVSPEAFVDNRAPAIQEFIPFTLLNDEPEVEVTEPETVQDLRLPHFPEPPGFDFTGYPVEQPYHVEVWVEKSTMDDVLVPLCRRYQVNLVNGAGQMSITFVVDFLKRVRHSDKPARILYISDYDKAGLSMPVAVARKVEFYQRNDGYGELDIKLEPICLTVEQVQQYDLPTAPDSWKVELDALAALHKGAFEKITEKALRRYIDPDLQRRVNWEAGQVEGFLRGLERDVLEQHDHELAPLQEEYAALRAEFSERVQAIGERLEEVYGTVHGELEEVDIKLEPGPEAEVNGDQGAMLYESGREYLDQLEYYKAQKRT